MAVQKSMQINVWPKNRRGAAMVEFAIVLMLLITLTFGMIEVGMVLRDDMSLGQLAHDAARDLSVGLTPAQVDANVRTRAATFGLVTDKAVLTVDPQLETTDASVTLTYHHKMITGLLWKDDQILHEKAVIRR